MSIGTRIAKLRRLNDLRQEEFAEKVGIHVTHVSRLENGKMRPRPHTLARIAEVFHMSVDELLSDGSQPAPTLNDPQLLKTFQMAEELDADDRHILFRMVHALVTKKRMERAMST